MKKFGRQTKILIALTAFMVFGAVAFFELIIWQFDRLSPEFRSTRQSVVGAIRECEVKMTEEAASFKKCTDDTEIAVWKLQALARSHYERCQYAYIRLYLTRLLECRKYFERSDVSSDARAHIEGLETSRRHVEEMLTKH
jgi:hypothetical protein